MKSANLLLHRIVCMCACLCRIITYSSGNDIITNKKNVAVYQSSTFDTCLASNVKNNLTLRSLDVDNALLCQTCSATDGNEAPWLQIDFSKKTMMRYMRIYGRDLDYSGQSSTILVSISNSSHFVNQNFSMWEDVEWINASDPFKGISIDFGDTRVLQYLVFRRPWPSVMAICEVAVLNIDCGNGFFGDKCANVCRCKDKRPCDSVTGKCSSPGCFAGWKGDSCSTSCGNGFFGDKCANVCRCKDKQPCDSVTGKCSSPGCFAGWKGDSCSTNCGNGFFGDKCANVCRCKDKQPCDSVTGKCSSPGCFAGWKGDSCSTNCGNGFFGDKCANVCRCKDKQPCDSVTGKCSSPGCFAGWQGDSCSTNCGNGFFGDKCANVCRCKDKQPCDSVTGKCSSPGCFEGWQGDSCSTTTNGEHSAAGYVAAVGVLSFVVVILIAVIVIMVMKTQKCFKTPVSYGWANRNTPEYRDIKESEEFVCTLPQL